MPNQYPSWIPRNNVNAFQTIHDQMMLWIADVHELMTILPEISGVLHPQVMSLFRNEFPIQIHSFENCEDDIFSMHMNSEMQRFNCK